MPAMLVSETSANLMQSGVLKANQTDLIEKATLNFIKPHPQLSNFYFADLSGNFIMVSKKDNLFTETRMQSATNKNTATIFKRNQQGNIVSKKNIPSTFDPKERPWFTGALDSQQQYWTNLYVFHSKKHPGITASFPVFDKSNQVLGVFGVDIEIEKVSHFLEKQIQSYAKTVLILDENKNIVAKPGEIAFNTGVDGSIKPLSVSDLNDKLIIKALEIYESKQTKTFDFKFNQQKFYTSIQAFPKNFGKDWTILVLLSQKNLVEQPLFTKNSFYMLFFSIVIFGLGFYGLILKLLQDPLRVLDKSIKVDAINVSENLEAESMLQR